MDTTIPCPGCGTKLNLADTGCPICLRGRSPQEITRGYARVRAEDAARKRRPFVVIAWLAAAAGGGYIFFNYQEPILGVVHGAATRFGRFYDQNSDPNYIAPSFANKDSGPNRPAPAPAPAPAPMPAPTRAPAPPVSRPAPAPAPPAAPRPHANAPEPALPHPENGQWILHGRAYDLATLEPAANTMISIKLGEGVAQTAVTDTEGYYAVPLPRLQSDNNGYTLETRDPRFATAVHFEGDIPYLRLPASERRRLIQSAQENDVHPTPISDVSGEEGIRRDAFLSPRH